MALTGGGWTVLYRWLSFEKDKVKWLLRWHQGDIFNLDPSGAFIKAPFSTAVGLITVCVVISGLFQLNVKTALKNRNTSRKVHHILGFILSIPIMLTAITGSIWAALKYWGGLDKESLKWLLHLHQVNSSFLFLRAVALVL